MLQKVISGGQTGVDRNGLEIANAMGIPTGGTAPLGYQTEYGSDFTLRDLDFVQAPTPDYHSRTIQMSVIAI